MLEVIKNKIGEFLLKEEAKKTTRNRKVCNIESARTIGIVYDATSREDYETVKRFILYLKEDRKHLKTMGYIHTKHEDQLLMSKLEYDFFCQKDLNWWQKPNKFEVDNFINEEFDILIDLNRDNCFPLKYICTLSKAKYKVGKFCEEGHHDLMINVADDISLRQFIVQLRHYLKIINNSDEQKN